MRVEGDRGQKATSPASRNLVKTKGHRSDPTLEEAGCTADLAYAVAVALS